MTTPTFSPPISEKVSRADAPTSGANQVADAPTALDAALAFWREIASPQRRKGTIILLYAVLALSVWKYIPPAPRFADPVSGRAVFMESATGEGAAFAPLDGTLAPRVSPALFLWNARKIWGAFLLMGVLPALIVKFVFREDLARYGLTLGDARRTVRTFLAFAPIMLALGWFSGGDKAFYSVYPYNPTAGLSRGLLALHSASYLLLYYLAWEFVFRGFIQRGLAETTGTTTAVLIQVVASTTLHYGHPASETFGCVAGGILWGFLALRTRSILSGWLQHAILGIALDWSLILAAGAR